MRKILVMAVGSMLTVAVAVLGTSVAFDDAPTVEARPTQSRMVSDLTAIVAMSYAGRYTFVVEEPEASTRAVRIDLDSGVDAYLYLLSGNNPSGTSYLAYGDNDGPGLDARITENLAPGTYTIVATTRDGGRKDDYTLTVSGHR